MKNLNLKKYFKIFVMRNSYLTAVLARYQEIYGIRNIEEVYSDEFFLQSLFMIFQNKSTKKDILKIMRMFPHSKRFFLIEIDPKIRYQRLNKNGFPGGKIDNNYAKLWMKNSEFNYNIIKEILFDNCKKLKDNPLEINI